MNRLISVPRPLTWLMALLIAALGAGCGGGGGGGVSPNAGTSSAKVVTAFSLGGVAGITNEAGKTIAVTMPTGTNVTALVATFTTTGASVKVGTTSQVSGITPNDFTTPEAYTVTAADGSTATYTVAVTVAAGTAKTVTVFSLGGVTGVINEANKTIAVTMPTGTNVTALVATFTTTGTSVKVGTITQVSGITSNDFTTPEAYTVTAADGSTATYTVAVTVAASSAKAVTAYSLAGIPGTIDEIAMTIAVALPSGTDITALAATFTTTGASVKIGTSTQVSGATANNFTVSPVAYTVTAADSSTAIYNVTVTVATAGPPPVPLGTAGNFAILTKTGITDVPASVITGNIGTSPITGASIGVTCPEVTGLIYSVDATGPACKVTNGTLLTTAVSNMETAYTDAAGRPAGVGPNLNIGGGTVANQSLAAGTYTWGSNVTMTTDLILNGSATDVWIFQIAGTFDMAPSKHVILQGGALAKNIFWQVAGTVTLGSGSHFEGIVLAKTNIAMITGASTNGRLLAQTAVALQQNTVAQPAP